MPISIAYTEQSDVEAVEAALRAELAGGPVTGLEPSEDDGDADGRVLDVDRARVVAIGVTAGSLTACCDAVSPLDGALVHLRAATRDDVPALARIRATPEVYRTGAVATTSWLRWRRTSPSRRCTAYVIEVDGAVVGWIQWQAEEEPDYRHASIDIYVDPACHGRGVGTDAVRTLAAAPVLRHGHHRIEIDPAADNVAAIRRTPRSGSARSGSPGVRSVAPTARGTTVC